MYAVWVWNGQAVICEDQPFRFISYKVHKKAYCYNTVKHKKDAIRECRIHSWKVVKSHFPKQEDDDV